MKVSTLYLTDISDYDNFMQKIISDIESTFVGSHFNSITLSRFISYLRQEFTNYAHIKFDIKTNVIITINRISLNLIEKNVDNNKNVIKIILNLEKIKDLLNGKLDNLEDFISEIIEQFNDFMIENKENNFSQYLSVQIKNLSFICFTELSVKMDKNIIKKFLKHTYGWIKLSHQSSIFNDYYQLFCSDRKQFGKIFFKFIRMLQNELNKDNLE